MTLKMIMTFGLLILAVNLHGQIVGLWEVNKVTVGQQEMTPVAKWTRINPDNSFQSGNGWLQNVEGVWSLDGNQYNTEVKNGIKDQYGPFETDIRSNEMTWQREEEGELVKVYLRRIDVAPKGPADVTQGLWDLREVTKDGNSILSTYDPDSKRYVFMRWDRIFVDDLGPDGRITGYWHMHGHRPSLTLINHDERKPRESWNVSFSENEMKWTGESNTNKGISMAFTRIDQFPKLSSQGIRMRFSVTWPYHENQKGNC